MPHYHRVPWLLVGFVLLIGVVNGGVSLIGDLRQPFPRIDACPDWIQACVDGVLLGLYVGEVSIVAMVAAWTGRRLIGGYTVGLIVGWLWTGALMLGPIARDYREWELSGRWYRFSTAFGWLANGLVIPFALLLAIIPITVMRAIRGTTVSRPDRGDAMSSRYSTRTFLVTLGVGVFCQLNWLASFLTIPRSAELNWEFPAAIMGVGVAGLLSNVAIAPWLVTWSLSPDDLSRRWRRIATLLAIVITAVATLGVVIVLVDSGPDGRELGKMMCSAGAFGVVFSLLLVGFLTTFRRSDYRLIRRPPAETSPPQLSTSWVSRDWVAPLGVLTVLSLIPLGIAGERLRVTRQWLSEFHELERTTQDLGGTASLDEGWDGEVAMVFLPNAPITDDELTKLAKFHQITLLDLDGTRIRGASLKSLGCANALMTLRLRNTPFEDSGCEHIATFTRLNCLHLDGTRISNRGLGAVASLQSLETLTMDGCAISDEGATHLGRLKRLEKLSLDGATIGETSARQLGALELRMLSLVNASLSDESVSRLKLRRMVYLNLAGTPISGRGLASWPAKNHLVTLILDESQVNDDEVSKWPTFPELRTLGLRQTLITDRSLPGLVKISESFQHPPVTLSLQTGQLSSECIEELRKHGYHVIQYDTQDAAKARRDYWGGTWLGF